MAIKDETNIEKALRLKVELDTTRSMAIQELLEQRKTISQQLADLGHMDVGRPVPRRSTPIDKKCPICGQAGHDGRRHKGEKKKK